MSFLPQPTKRIRNVTLGLVSGGPAPIVINPWILQLSAADNNWTGVAWNGSVFAAVASSGIGNRVMTSPDGINWTIQVSAANQFWFGIAALGSRFCAFSQNGGTSQFMTSDDGIAWTLRSNPTNKSWTGIAAGNGTFVAVSQAAGINQIATSPDGVTWTDQVSPIFKSWRSIWFDGSLFYAVSQSQSGTDQVMTSPDGIAWALAGGTALNGWITGAGNATRSIILNGTTGELAISPAWALQSLAPVPAAVPWRAALWTGSFFIAVSNNFNGAVSFDGLTWIEQLPAASQSWTGLAHNGSVAVAVANNGVGTRVMTMSL